MTRTPLITGNWKMNLDHLQAIALVQKLSWSLGDVKHDFGSVEVAVFPPFTDLRSVQTLISADKLAIQLGAQDVSSHEPGAHTGEIAAEFLAKLDTQFVLVGHSERREFNGESDEVIAAKVRRTLSCNMIPVLCVGETAADRERLGPSEVPLAQLRAALAGSPETAEVVVAYEPVWAIGTGQAASPEDAQQVIHALREEVSSLLGGDTAEKTRFLYGGSVKSDNVAAFMREPDIDGVLVGGASLDADEFSRIVQFQKHVTREA